MMARPVEAVPGEPVNFCTWCGCPVTSEAVRQADDEAPAPEPVPCTRCGAILEGERRFCTVCGMSQTEEAPGDFLERVLAKDTRTTPDDPRFQASIARIREEQPEAWDALVQLIAAPVKA